MKKSALVVCLVVMSCSRGGDHGMSLRDTVNFYCHEMTRHALEHAAEEYGKLAPLLDGNQLSPGQRQRAEQQLRIDAIAVTEDVRRAQLQNYDRRLFFCAIARDVDDHRQSDFQVRSAHLVESLNANLAGTMPTHAQTAKLLGDLAALAREIDEAPLKR